MLSLVSKAAKTAKILSYEYYNDKVNRHFDAEFIPISTNQIAVTFKDITERKKAEEALVEGECRYRGLYNAVADGIIVVDCNGAISEVNEFACKILGYSREEIKNSLIKPIWHAINEDGSPFPMENHPAMVTLKTGKSVRDVVMGVYLPNTGEYKWLVFNSEPMFNSQKGIESAVITFVDITERKKSERALEGSQKKYRDLTETTNDFVWEMDAQGRYTYCSPQMEKLWGYKPAEMLGKSPFDVMPPDEKERVLELFKEEENSPKPFSGLQMTSYDSQGRLIFIEINGVPFFDIDGKFLGFRGISRDITERKTLEKQLQDNERMAAIGQTAGMIGHDIRNPLQAIISELYLAKEDIAQAPEGKHKQESLESVSFVEEQVNYVSKIVSDLQDFARPLNPEYQIVNLSDLLVSVFDAIVFPDKIKLKVDARDNVKLKTDATFIRRAITNLVNNAIQAMPDGGELGLSAQKKEEYVAICVSDTGQGIPEHVKANLFKPLTTTKAKGQGLGLAVVKRLVEALNGKVSFESEEGKGTKFIIELPA